VSKNKNDETPAEVIERLGKGLTGCLKAIASLTRIQIGLTFLLEEIKEMEEKARRETQ